MEWKSRDDLIASIPERLIPTFDDLSYADFLAKHLAQNTPFLLGPKATESWPSRCLWALPSDGPSYPNLEALKPYGEQLVPVADTRNPQWSEFERSDRPLRDVLDLWSKGDGDGLYVKDWHLIAEIVNQGGWEGDVYEVPECFRDDWLNPPYRCDAFASPPSSSDASTSDFRFTYVGPPGTFTPLHRDVYGSYSWSANVVGRKVWWLFPPDRLASVKRNGELVFDVRDVRDEGGGIKILQQEGEVIFVPSGWHHQVVNVDFCISINHNFFCSITLPFIFAALEESQKRVEESIADVKVMIRERLGHAENESGIPLWRLEWAEEVQALLERDAGWGWRGFWRSVLHNLRLPSAPRSLRPSDLRRDQKIREVIARYHDTENCPVLADVLVIIAQIERMLSPDA